VVLATVGEYDEGVRRFSDRSEAGRQLGVRLSSDFEQDAPIVLGLPRGGVVVAYEVARVLRSPLDFIVVRKIGVPSQRELAMGALAEGDVVVKESEVCDGLRVSEEQFQRAVARELLELERRSERLRQRAPAFDLTGQSVLIIDDGVATGATARAAIASARSRRAAWVGFATPVASAASARELARIADLFVALELMRGPFSVGSRYERFAQVSDREVDGYLARSRRASSSAFGASSPVEPSKRHPSIFHRRSP
jgi:putative phosphoribosyl transferase